MQSEVHAKRDRTASYGGGKGVNSIRTSMRQEQITEHLKKKNPPLHKQGEIDGASDERSIADM